MQHVFFADQVAERAGFAGALGKYIDALRLGTPHPLRADDRKRFSEVSGYLKSLDPDFDVGNQVLPAILWLRFAFKYWFKFGGASSTCLAMYGKWRNKKHHNSRLCLVAPDHVAAKIERGELDSKDIQNSHDCYSLDVFLYVESLGPDEMSTPWRVVVVKPGSDSNKSEKNTSPKRTRSYEASVGSEVYRQAEEAIRSAAEHRALGRKLSQRVDKKTRKYLYEGRRADLLASLKAQDFAITAAPELGLKLISRFVQCRKGPVDSRS